jgi:mycothiol synthase
VAASEALDRAVRAARGHEAFNEDILRDLRAPVPAGRTVDVERAGAVVALGHALPARAGVSEAGIAALPGSPPDVWSGAFARVAEVAAELGAREVVVWVIDPDAAVDEGAGAAGFRLQRELHQMRVPLPLADGVRGAGPPPGVELRPFVPGRDEDAWLAVNNRAFAGHPEQGAWERATIEAREREPWFDPAGLVLAWRGDELVGSCWTKVHAATDDHERLGEIYVIGVDPAAHGLGLGRVLTVAGLDHLAGLGIATGMLYVDGANDAATGLYRSLGFETHRMDRAYSRPLDVP